MFAYTKKQTKMKTSCFRLSALSLVIILFCVTCDGNTKPQSDETEIYKNPKYSIDGRVNDLILRMTLTEKIGQMIQIDRGFLEKESDIKDYFIGSILSGGGSSPSPNEPSAWADMVDNFQQQAVSTRLGIPLIYGIDAVHGHNNVHGAVIFPHNIGMGCTRNPELVQQAARVMAREVAGTGIRWTFSPCIAVVRNERWGRTYEGFGETPELAGMMAEAAVRGYQGNDLSDNTSILACAKHYLGDGGTTDGHDQGNTEVDEATMRRLHLPGYISAVNAGTGSIMASYNSWNGEKLHGNQYWLTTVLKEELGFEGFLVSDWSGIDQLPGDFASDIETAVNAGIDMVMLPQRYKEFMLTTLDLVNQGKISIKRIDDAVSRILRMKFALGLFESPFTDRSLTGTIGCQEHRNVARECVRQSLVLLKNENSTLPIADSVTHIHVAGKNADNLGHQCGGWTISWGGGSGNITIGTTILEAIRQRAETGTQVTFSSDGLGAGNADVAIAVIGETPYAEGNGDRSDLSLSAEDISTVINLRSFGIPTVVVLISGRPMILDNLMLYSDAIIAAWLPGTEGQGVADVLFGDFVPTGKLSHTWSRSMSQIPINYGDIDYDPLFEYGFGLTFSKK